MNASDERERNPSVDDAAVFRDLYPSLLAYAKVVADAGVDAADLVQDALVATLGSQQLVELEHPQAYLRRGVLSAAIGRQRKQATFAKYAPELIDTDNHGASYPSDLSDLDHLEPRDRAILYLVHVEGCSYREVAELTDEKEDVARRRASRARQQLKGLIENEAAETDQENER